MIKVSYCWSVMKFLTIDLFYLNVLAVLLADISWLESYCVHTFIGSKPEIQARHICVHTCLNFIITDFNCFQTYLWFSVHYGQKFTNTTFQPTYATLSDSHSTFHIVVMVNEMYVFSDHQIFQISTTAWLFLTLYNKGG